VDIEKVDASHCKEEVARLVFTSGEFNRWMALEAAERTAVFFRVWTRKEAIVKATGEGLGRATDTFAVPWTRSRPRQVSLAAPAPLRGLWLRSL
jgi:4'-phosphopantetheinyl transferase